MNIKFITRKECISCKSKNIEILKSKPFLSDIIFDYLKSYYGVNVKDLNLENQNLEYSSCINCSMVWQKYILNKESLEYLYETLISAEWSLNKRECGSYNQFSSYIEDAKRVKYFYPNKQPRDVKVLDFGMGWGHYCIASNAVGFDAYGCELSNVRIKFAQIHGVKVIKNTKEINDNYYDFINTQQVFEHLSDPFEIMRELKLFSQFKIKHYENLDLCIKDADKGNQLVVFFTNPFNTIKIDNFPSILIIEPSNPINKLSGDLNVQLKMPFRILDFKKKIISLISKNEFKKNSLIHLSGYIVDKNERKIKKNNLELQLSEREINFSETSRSHSECRAPFTNEVSLQRGVEQRWLRLYCSARSSEGSSLEAALSWAAR